MLQEEILGSMLLLVYFTAIYLPVLKRVIRYFEITKIIVSGLHRYFCITSVAFRNRVLVKVSARSSPLSTTSFGLMFLKIYFDH